MSTLPLVSVSAIPITQKAESSTSKDIIVLVMWTDLSNLTMHSVLVVQIIIIIIIIIIVSYGCTIFEMSPLSTLHLSIWVFAFTCS